MLTSTHLVQIRAVCPPAGAVWFADGAVIVVGEGNASLLIIDGVHNFDGPASCPVHMLPDCEAPAMARPTEAGGVLLIGAGVLELPPHGAAQYPEKWVQLYRAAPQAIHAPMRRDLLTRCLQALPPSAADTCLLDVVQTPAGLTGVRVRSGDTTLILAGCVE
jgi:hypothetical protein